MCFLLAFLELEEKRVASNLSPARPRKRQRTQRRAGTRSGTTRRELGFLERSRGAPNEGFPISQSAHMIRGGRKLHWSGKSPRVNRQSHLKGDLPLQDAVRLHKSQGKFSPASLAKPSAAHFEPHCAVFPFSSSPFSRSSLHV